MYDHFDDRSRKVLYGISKVIDLPGFVKEAEEADEDDRSVLPDSCFADPLHRKYPMHTKKDAYLSRLYFTKYASMYPRPAHCAMVRGKLETAAKFWGLEDTYKIIKTASVDNRIPVLGYDGSEVDSMPLNTPRDFEKAAIQIFENKSSFTYPQRRQIARTLLDSELKKEAKVADEVSEYLEKAAGYGMSTLDNVLDVLEKRASAYGHRHPEFAEKMMEAATFVSQAEITPKVLDKLASALDACDHHLGMRRFYGKALETPEEALFCFTEKLCNDISTSLVKLHNGQVISLEKLSEEVLNNFFDSHLGEIPDASYEEKLDIVRSLPTPDADALVDFVR